MDWEEKTPLPLRPCKYYIHSQLTMVSKPFMYIELYLLRVAGASSDDDWARVCLNRMDQTLKYSMYVIVRNKVIQQDYGYHHTNS